MSDEHEEIERPRLLSVEIGDFPGLGGRAGFDLGERVTVLVGRNGAGKSLLVEGMGGAIGFASYGRWGGEKRLPPRYFRCAISLPNRSSIVYQYGLSEFAEIEGEDLDVLGIADVLEERCWDPNDNHDIWRIDKANIIINGASRPFMVGMGLLAMGVILKIELPTEALLLKQLFSGVNMIPAGVPRSAAGERLAITLRRKKTPLGTSWDSTRRGRDCTVASGIARLWDDDKERFQEFAELLHQLGIVRDVKVVTYENAAAEEDPKSKSLYAEVLFDGVNFGLCADGTQRIADIVKSLIAPERTCLLIEEPETSIHPSLLSRLLAIFESYSLDRQIVIATHSPQIVDWCKPKDLRLVERVDDRTVVSPLGPDDLRRVYNYLADDGTLSEYIYNRGEA